MLKIKEVIGKYNVRMNENIRIGCGTRGLWGGTGTSK
jgi:hypothetical protein